MAYVRRISLALLLFAAVVGGARFRMTTAPGTEIVRWSPVDANGQLVHGLSPGHEHAGRCEDDGSLLLSYVDRCYWRSGIYDPCWPLGNGTAHRAVCVSSPWARRVSVFRNAGLRPVLAKRVDIATEPPWAIELATGPRCVLFSGAHASIGVPGRGLVVDYYCPHHLVLLRNLRRGGIWRIGLARSRSGASTMLGDREIRRVFYGAATR